MLLFPMEMYVYVPIIIIVINTIITTVFCINLCFYITTFTEDHFLLMSIVQ